MLSVATRPRRNPRCRHGSVRARPSLTALATMAARSLMPAFLSPSGRVRNAGRATTRPSPGATAFGMHHSSTSCLVCGVVAGGPSEHTVGAPEGSLRVARRLAARHWGRRRVPAPSVGNARGSHGSLVPLRIGPTGMCLTPRRRAKAPARSVSISRLVKCAARHAWRLSCEDMGGAASKAPPGGSGAMSAGGVRQDFA